MGQIWFDNASALCAVFQSLRGKRGRLMSHGAQGR